MTKEQKAQWIEALRSGKYKQGTCRLYNKDTNKYCCLGVAEASLSLTATDGANDGFVSWSFLDLGVQRELTELNDVQHLSFIEIADYIEKNL